MRVKRVKVDNWMDAFEFLNKNDATCLRELRTLRSKLRFHRVLTFIFIVGIGYQISNIKDQIAELHRQIVKTNERVDEQEDALTNNILE